MTPKIRNTFRVLAFVLRPLMNLLLAKKWSGAENLPDSGFIVCPNHVTEIDPVVVGHFLYNHGVMPHFLTKASLFKVPVFGAALRESRQVPVERGGSAAQGSLAVAREVLDDGGGIIIYPEGSLTRDPDYWPMKGRTGAARLALETGAPVVPVVHWGAQELFPRYAKRIHPFPRKTVRVVAGKPVDLSAFADRPLDKATLDQATDVILDAVTALLEDLRGESAPPERWDPKAKNQTAYGRVISREAETSSAEDAGQGSVDPATKREGQEPGSTA
ncbi:lysophospholipid acyltransferase family protein [Arthrobacter castelli]|uniref:lysophospholipid acyltransferase family protein n=1 Tax=Arthrobacter castelli TaxID=271431 RepID=UPI0003FBF7B5|nr:lysophospholipid acyltransferase family protein [Arthrobacter castelli]